MKPRNTEKNTSIAAVMLRMVLPPVIVFVLFVSVWQAGIFVAKVPEFLIPSPVRVADAFVEHRSELLTATWSTAKAALAGFCLSLVIGCASAFVMAQAKVLERSFYPYAIFLQTVPIIAIAPIIILWLGPGMPSIITVSFIISLFPIITNATTGLTNLPPGWLELMDVYEAGWWPRLMKLRIPAAIPHIVTGAKVSAGLSVVGAIVGEYFTSVSGKSYGIAYLVIINADNARTAYLFATTIMSAILGLLIFGAVTVVGNAILKLGHFGDS